MKKASKETDHVINLILDFYFWKRLKKKNVSVVKSSRLQNLVIETLINSTLENLL